MTSQRSDPPGGAVGVGAPWCCSPASSRALPRGLRSPCTPLAGQSGARDAGRDRWCSSGPSRTGGSCSCPLAWFSRTPFCGGPCATFGRCAAAPNRLEWEVGHLPADRGSGLVRGRTERGHAAAGEQKPGQQQIWRHMMTRPFTGIINMDIRDSVPDWGPYEQPRAPEDAPNVLYIVLDDVGFGALSCFGGLIETPNIDRIAQNGVRYIQWHTTALCSPTRSCLLTGRNHTTNGMACITECATGFPGSNGHIPFENATIAEMLVERGYNTYIVGKWHLCPEDEMNLAATKRNWPLGRGFERFYGFLGAETNQYYPDLVHDNHPVDPPNTPEEGYHFTEDITDKALAFVRDAREVAPDKPFFLYYAPGATHAPHQVPKEWIERYRGRFDMGYERARELILQRQKELGIVPPHTTLPPLNPLGTSDTRTGPHGHPFPQVDCT